MFYKLPEKLDVKILESKKRTDLSDDKIESVANICEQDLILPSEKNTNPVLIAFIGQIASGKSTLGQRLSQEIGLIRINND